MVDKYANTGVSKTIEVYYKHEEVRLKDVFIFKVHMLLDSSKVWRKLFISHGYFIVSRSSFHSHFNFF